MVYMSSMPVCNLEVPDMISDYNMDIANIVDISNAILPILMISNTIIWPIMYTDCEIVNLG